MDYIVSTVHRTLFLKGKCARDLIFLKGVTLDCCKKYGTVWLTACPLLCVFYMNKEGSFFLSYFES